MAKLALYIALFATCISSFIYPYIPVLAYYTLAILQPQAIWFWAFSGVRASYIAAIAAIIGFLVSFIRNPDFQAWKSKQIFCLLGLWLWMFLSMYFGAFPTRSFGAPYENASWLITTASKMFLIVFIAVYLIKTPKELKYLCWAIILSIAYLIYWGNMQYINGAIFHNPLCRLKGPHDPFTGAGVYYEENTFAMLFVTTLPFFYYFFQYEKNKLLKFFLLLLIPLGWHCIFLTGSRGGFLGLGITILYAALRSKKKLIGAGLIIALIVAFVWQGGSLMKKRAESIEGYHQDKSAVERLQSWRLGKQMMFDYPLFGVGLGNFIVARRVYGDSTKLIAMSTPIEFGAECGVPAMMLFLGLIGSCFLDLRRIRKQVGKSEQDDLLLTITNATECALVGFFICSLFLSLQVFEPFYLLVAMVVVLKNYYL